jgi:Na+/glutamate symporter
MEAASTRARPPEDADALRRKWKRFLILGIALMLGPIFGVLGLAFGMGLSYRRIETMPAPTPRDLSEGVWIGTASATIGMLAGIAGAILALWSYRKLTALRPETSAGPWK